MFAVENAKNLMIDLNKSVGASFTAGLHDPYFWCQAENSMFQCEASSHFNTENWHCFKTTSVTLEFANKKFILSIDFDTDLGYRVQFVGRNNRMWSVSQLHWGQGEGMATQAFALGPGHAPRFLAST